MAISNDRRVSRMPPFSEHRLCQHLQFGAPDREVDEVCAGVDRERGSLPVM
jgi:hypothetical protein